MKSTPTNNETTAWLTEGITEKEFFARWALVYDSKKERTRRSRKAYYQLKAPTIRTQLRESYRRHSKKRVEFARDYRKKMKLDPVRMDRYRKLCREKARVRSVTDIKWLLRKKLRTRINMAFKHYEKSRGTVELVGCSMEQLKKHLESLWAPGMSWSNYGRWGWHIDHKKPCIAFDLSNPEEQRACFHYTNLQPLWEYDNLSKGHRI